MWPELGNAWTEGRSSSSNTSPMVASSFHPSVVHEIHVLLVDHDSESLVSTAKLLEICQYRVTFVELASAAISMLLSGKAKFDVVMANVNSPDLHGFKLLQHAATMGLPVVLMSAEENSLMAMRALENGAFLYIKKPATLDIMRCLWQHVLREKTRLVREREMLASVNNNNKNANNANTIVSTNHGSRVVNHDHQFKEMNNNRGFENPNYYNNSNNNNNVGRVSGHLHHVMMKNNKGKAKKKIRGISRHGLINGLDEDECDSDSFHVMVENSNNNNSGNVKRKMCTEWTQELHAKFMDAVEQLGEGRCFPKEILELMDVPGLTRMQVASHLQKCRNDNWRSPLERRANQANHDSSPDANGAQPKPRRFGSKPQLGRTRSGPAQESHGTRQGSETHSEAETPHSGGGHVTPTNENGSPQEQYGSSVVPGPSNIRPGAHSSSNPRQHSTDEFFNFPEMDCLMQNLSSGLPQAPAVVVNNPSPSGGSYHVDPAYNDQNSAGPSAETRSNWSSETSNFESDHS